MDQIMGHPGDLIYALWTGVKTAFWIIISLSVSGFVLFAGYNIRRESATAKSGNLPPLPSPAAAYKKIQLAQAAAPSTKQFWAEIRQELSSYLPPAALDVFVQTYEPLYDGDRSFPSPDNYVDYIVKKRYNRVYDAYEYAYNRGEMTAAEFRREQKRMDEDNEGHEARIRSDAEAYNREYPKVAAEHLKKLDPKVIEITRTAIVECGKQIGKGLPTASGWFYTTVEGIWRGTTSLESAMRGPLDNAVQKHSDLKGVLFENLSKCEFDRLRYASVPFDIPFHTLYAHMHVLAGSRGGKTTWLKAHFMSLLNMEQQPSIIVMDSQGDLIREISHLDVFHPEHGRLRDKLIIISAREIQFPPALNIFDIPLDRISSSGEAGRELILSGVIDTFKYLFDHLLEIKLTEKQEAVFSNILGLLITMPETMGRAATLQDMVDIMRKPQDYLAAIEALEDEEDRRFFLEDFMASKKNQYEDTKQQIAYRLEALRKKHPAIRRLFTSPKNGIDLYTAMNNGSIILIDTARDLLKGNVSIYGRVLLSMVVNAALERAPIPEEKRHPTFFIIDEAWQYFDAKSAEMLVEVRKYHLGCVLAHHGFWQTKDTPGLAQAFQSSTAIKMATKLDDEDIPVMAKRFRVDPEFFNSVPPFHFVTHIDGYTQNGPIVLPIPFGVMEAAPRMDEAAYDRLLTRNRQRTGAKPKPVNETRARPTPQPREQFGKQSSFDDDEVIDAEYTEVRRNPSRPRIERQKGSDREQTDDD